MESYRLNASSHLDIAITSRTDFMRAMSGVPSALFFLTGNLWKTSVTMMVVPTALAYSEGMAFSGTPACTIFVKAREDSVARDVSSTLRLLLAILDRASPLNPYCFDEMVLLDAYRVNKRSMSKEFIPLPLSLTSNERERVFTLTEMAVEPASRAEKQ